MHTKQLYSPLINEFILSSNSFLFICPWAYITLASGANIFISRTFSSISETLLYKIKICPFLDISLYIISLIIFLSSSITYVWTECLFFGGVSIKDKFLNPTIAICKVLGMGVAVSVKTSIFDLNSLIFSLCATPNRCSSSITNNPKSFGIISLLNNLCVPIKKSIFPSLKSFNICFVFFGDVNLFNKVIFIGKFLNLSLALSYCWLDNKVVGHKYKTCFESAIALNITRNATSVFPYPTSPHKILSIGLILSISFLICCVVDNWSFVISYSNSFSNISCIGVSILKANPFCSCLSACTFKSLPASYLIFSFTLCFVLAQAMLFKELIFGTNPSFPEYLLINSILEAGIYNLSFLSYKTSK